MHQAILMHPIVLEKAYHIATHDFIVAARDSRWFPLLLRDRPRTDRSSWEEFGERDMPEYFRKGWAIFVERVKRFKNLERSLMPQEEKELKFMLEALIDAKNILEDRFERSS